MEGRWRGDRDDPVEQRAQSEPVEDADGLWWDDLLEADAEAAKDEPEVDWDALGPEPVENIEPEPQDEPERPYRGGRYGDLPTEAGIERHHLIAAASLKAAGIEPGDGLAIQMERADHKETASYGPYARAQAYRDEQTKLLLAGRSAEALAMGILDVQVKFGARYLLALEEAIDAADR